MTAEGRLYKIAVNLRNTIVGKEFLLETYRTSLAAALENERIGRGNIATRFAMEATIQYIELNLTELRAILKDVEA
jgi:hypothetical protein